MKKPNIIMVFVDDLGYGDISCFNENSKVYTPNIDKLSKEGMSFTDMHATAAVCTPSRYSMLTGRYNWRSRLKNTAIPGTAEPLIEENRKTIGHIMQEAGYKTACVGKWHLGMGWQKNYEDTVFSDSMQAKVSDRADFGIAYDKPILNGPNEKGFDYFFGMPASIDLPPYVFIENNMAESYADITVGVELNDFRTEGPTKACLKGPRSKDFNFQEAIPRCDKKVLDLVEEYSKGEDPFFVFYPTLAVHTPLVPTDEFAGKSDIGPYGDMILQLDDFMGKLDCKLKNCGIYDDTIVIFTSDNGCSEEVDIPSLQAKGHFPSYHFRGAKCDIWDGGHRIPFIVRWKNEIKPNSIHDTTTCLVDMFATLAEIGEVSYGDENGEDSFSNLSLWKGSSLSVREHTIHHSLFGMFAIREGDWKLEMCAGSGSNNFPFEGMQTQGMYPIQLYNLAEDIAEKNNLAEQNPEIVQRLKNILAEYIKSGRSTQGQPQENYPCENWPGLHWLINN